MITLTEVARICGVSTATVSNILNGKHKSSETTRQKVLDVVKATGYTPNYFAQGMRKRQTRIIGILVEDLGIFTTPPIVESIIACCEDSNYRTILVNMRMYDKWQDTWYSDEKKLQSILQPSIQELLSVKVDGILYVAGHNRTINYFPEDFRIPVVIVYALSSSPKFPSVIIDDEKGGYDITKYLISMGHRRIGMIAGTMNNQHTRMRSLGFQKALFEERILFNPDWVRYGTWKRDSGYEETERLIQEGVSAIFCMNDYMAGGVYDYLYERDMVAGEDISLVGYDNNEISEYLKPALTTNRIQFKEIGMQSANLLIGMIEGTLEKINMEDNVGRIEKIPCHMVIRESVKRLP